MAPGNIIDLKDLPYLSKTDLRGRFICSMIFYINDEWRTWVEIEEEGKRLIEIQAWPAETFYFGDKEADPADIHSVLLHLVGQHVNMKGFERVFLGLRDDFLNLATSFAKLDFIAKNATLDNGMGRIVATEVEYLLLVCRSIFDLLQELIKAFWQRAAISDGLAKKQQLKDTFSDMTLRANVPRTVEDIAERFKIPAFLAEYYARHSPVFAKIREFRDGIVHGGKEMQTIFCDGSDFAISQRLGPFINPNIWRLEELQENSLVPLLPALGMIVHGTLAACEDFAVTISDKILVLEPTMPGLNLYLRGYHNRYLKNILNDANSRVAEGRTLVG